MGRSDNEPDSGPETERGVDYIDTTGCRHMQAALKHIREQGFDPKDVLKPDTIESLLKVMDTAEAYGDMEARPMKKSGRN